MRSPLAWMRASALGALLVGVPGGCEGYEPIWRCTQMCAHDGDCPSDSFCRLLWDGCSTTCQMRGHWCGSGTHPEEGVCVPDATLYCGEGTVEREGWCTCSDASDAGEPGDPDDCDDPGDPGAPCAPDRLVRGGVAYGAVLSGDWCDDLQVEGTYCATATCHYAGRTLIEDEYAFFCALAARSDVELVACLRYE